MDFCFAFWPWPLCFAKRGEAKERASGPEFPAKCVQKATILVPSSATPFQEVSSNTFAPNQRCATWLTRSISEVEVKLCYKVLVFPTSPNTTTIVAGRFSLRPASTSTYFVQLSRLRAQTTENFFFRRLTALPDSPARDHREILSFNRCKLTTPRTP